MDVNYVTNRNLLRQPKPVEFLKRMRPKVINDVRAVSSGIDRPEALSWREVAESGRRSKFKVAA